MQNLTPIPTEAISPYIRYVNNYAPVWSYTEPERILFDHEFMYVVNGHCHIRYDGREYDLEKGDLFYIQPGIVNQMTVNGAAGFQTHCIHFDWTMPPPEEDFSVIKMYIEQTFDEEYYKNVRFLSERQIYFPSDLRLPTHIKNTPAKLYELFSRCYYAYLKNDFHARMQLKADFIRILALLWDFTTSGSNTGTVIHPSISRAVEYIQLNYHSPLSVASLAEECHLSEKYFGTLFRKNLGKSINQFLLETRIDAARNLLISTPFSIEEISLKVGFDTVYYFSNCFKKVMSMTPTTFRKMYTRE